jgi:hypothetical protein
VVTGASSGIGRALACRLAETGLNLVLVARSGPLLDALAAQLTARHGVQVRVLELDLARHDQLAVLRAATDPLEVGLLVAAAGFGSSGPFLDADLASETEMLMVNSRALMQACFHFGRRFRAQGRGGLVLLSSIVGFQGMPYAAHYAATKAYVLALAEALQVELSACGVDVLAAAPGPTHSVSRAEPACAWATPSTPKRSPSRSLRLSAGRPPCCPAVSPNCWSTPWSPCRAGCGCGSWGR